MDIKNFRLATLLCVAMLNTSAFAETQAPEYYRDNPLPPPPPAPTSRAMEEESQGMMPYSPQNQRMSNDVDPGINDNVTPPRPGQDPVLNRGMTPPPPGQDRGMETGTTQPQPGQPGLDRGSMPPPPNQNASDLQAPAPTKRVYKPGRAPRATTPGNSLPSTTPAPVTAPSTTPTTVPGAASSSPAPTGSSAGSSSGGM